MKRWIALLTWLVTVALLLAAPQSVTVKSVHDGDTFTATRAEGSKIRIRLAAVDAPELKQAWGDSARRFAAALLTGPSLVKIDSQSVDRYGRIVARVTVADTVDLSLVLVKNGLAWWYVKYAPGDSGLAQTERKARADRRGLWGDSLAPVAPWEYRHKK